MKSTAQKSKKQKSKDEWTPTEQQYLQSATAIVRLIDGADHYGIPDFLTLEIMDALVRAATMTGSVLRLDDGQRSGS